MARYAISVQTTGTDAGAADDNIAAAVLAAANREVKLVGVQINPHEAKNSALHAGEWVVDRISAYANGSVVTPGKIDPASVATGSSARTSASCAVTATTVDAKILVLSPGWNNLEGLGIRSGPSNGLAVRRATAPGGSEVCDVTLVFEDV